MMWGMDKRLVIVALVLAVLFFGGGTLLVACGEPTPPLKVIEPVALPDPAASVPTSAAVPCELVEVRDTSFPGRERRRAFIAAPVDLTVDQRAQTALVAAVEIQRNTGSAYVLVQMAFDSEAMSAGWAAEAEYAPDGFDQSGETRLRNGTWEASVSKLSPTADDLAIFRSWDKHRESYRGGDSMLDEGKLKLRIAKETGATAEAIDAALLKYGFGQPLEDYP
jgi:hypothetical protein